MFGECHGHLFMNGENYRQAVALHEAGVNCQDVRKKLEQYRREGISFFRDGGDYLGVSRYARQIAGEYGIDYRTPLFAIHKNGHYGKIVGRGFDTMKEYHKLVLEVKKGQGDFIKVMFSGILDFATDGHVTGTALSNEEIREMIHIAHEEGFAVMAHVNGPRAVLSAIEGGVDSVEHGNFMDEDCFQALAESDAVWVPTLVTITNLLGSGRFQEEVIQELARRQRNGIRRAMKLGGILALGSDAGAFRVLHGRGIRDEYQEFLKLFGDTPELDRCLCTGEKKIREKFSRK